jgi:hypothetical protein
MKEAALKAGSMFAKNKDPFNILILPYRPFLKGNRLQK